MMYRLECWAVNKKIEQGKSVAEIRLNRFRQNKELIYKG